MKMQYIVYILVSISPYPILKNCIKATEQNQSLYFLYDKLFGWMNM